VSTLPDFVIPGAQKSGTTALKINLEAHPDVFFPPECGAEVHFFDKNWSHGIEWYEGLYEGQKHKIKGDKTPVYMYLPAYVERMAQVLPPSTKIIVCLRNPVDRAISQFEHHRRNGAPLEFEEYLNREQMMVEFGQEPDATTAPTDFLRRGIYGPQIERLYQHFDREQVLFVITERMYRRTEAETNRVLAFLGLDPVTLPDPHRKRRDYDTGADLRRAMARFFALDIKRTFDLIGFEVEEWMR